MKTMELKETEGIETMEEWIKRMNQESEDYEKSLMELTPCYDDDATDDTYDRDDYMVESEESYWGRLGFSILDPNQE